MKFGKRMRNALENINSMKNYPVEEALQLVKEYAKAKFDETIEIKMHLAVDPKHADQLVRGTVSLPNGTGKSIKVMAICKGENQKIAEEAGADFVGFDEIIEEIKNGKMDMDVVITTPDCMSEVGKLGRVLGPRGLMPNPKSGTVTNDIGKAVQELKAGRIEFRTDKYGIVHSIIGKASFKESSLFENFNAFVGRIIKVKPPSVKGRYIISINVCSTMGPSVAVDLQSAVG